MEINIEQLDNGFVKVAPSGEATIYGAPELKKALIDGLRGSKGLEVDLSGVSQLDTSGVQVLVLAWIEAGNSGKGFTVTARSEAAESVFGLFRLDGSFGRQNV